ncbi:hypothetical protein BDFB_012966 [Asbolus verrucosus]|uniref:Uncharacterized protein n=1 Tax=Asbolus verrucosus TaxID=1661398 RepID=A0A482VMY1_ASBVE|nr:hypothetical protein BDFB_012966 [Asbolus verrucosus]
MENGLILCESALKNFGNVFLLALLVFLIKTFKTQKENSRSR